MRHINETVEQLGGELRRETLNGEEYLVAPVVAIQEGVYLYPRANGRGIKRELLNTEEIEQSLSEWEGVPLTIPHPEDDEGRPGLITNKATTHNEVGEFRDVELEEGALVGETWIRANTIGTLGGMLESYVEGMKAGEPQEVSTGYRADTEVSKGSYENQRYTYEQVGLEPDHLALLVDEAGNCSVEEGCGAGQTLNRFPFAGEDGVRVNNRRARANATPEQIELAREVAENFVAVQGDATLQEFERWVRENESLGPNEQTAAMAVFDELFSQDPSQWGVESDFLNWLDQQSGEDRENTLGAISDPSGAVSVHEGTDMSDTGPQLIDRLVQRLNNLIDGREPQGDLDADDAETTETMNGNIDREKLIEQIVTNSEIKKESLEGMGDSCLKTTHDNIVNSVDTSGDGDGQQTAPDGGDGDAGADSVDPEKIRELSTQIEEQADVIEQLKSEREEEREEKEEQVNQRLIENTELAEETVADMDLSDKQKLVDDLGASGGSDEDQTVNMNGIPDSGAANDFEVDADEEASEIPAPGRTNYERFKDGDN